MRRRASRPRPAPLGQLVVERRRAAPRARGGCDRRPALGGEPRGGDERLLGLGGSRTGTTIVRYSTSSRPPRRRADGLAQRKVQEPPPVDRVDDEADHEPAETDVARRRRLDDDDDPRGRGPEATEEREQRPVDPAERTFGRARYTNSSSRRPVPQRDERHVRDREREHRAERVHRPEEVRSRPGRMRIDTIPAKTMSESHGVLNRGCTRRKTSGSWR